MGTYVHILAGAGRPIPNPVAGNLVEMDSAGQLIDAGATITESSLSNDNTHVPTTEAMQAAILAGVAAGYTFQGEWDASGGAYPTLNYLGAPIAMGDNWRIVIGGTLPGGKVVFEGDNLLALINVPGQTPTNWSVSIGTGVRKFNGRDGLVSPTSGDYSVTQVTGAAPINNPTFTGTVTVPTPSGATDASTKGYVDTGLALKADAAATTAALALKANLASPTFTGTVTVPTPSGATDASTKGYVDTGLALKINTSAAEIYNAAGNTPNSIAERDGSGSLFANSANICTAASQMGVTPNTTDTLLYPVFVNFTGPSFQGAHTNSNYNYNAVTNTLSVNVAGYALLSGATFIGTVTVPTPSGATDASTKGYVDTGLALKANLASPTFTGTVIVPSQSALDNSTKSANTTYVDSAVTATTKAASIVVDTPTTILLDLSLINFVYSPPGNRLLGVPTNIRGGQSGFISVRQDTTGSRLLTYDWPFEFSGGAAPVLSTNTFSFDQLYYNVNYYYTSVVTMTIATPCVVTYTAHSLLSGQKVRFTTTGALPTGVSAGVTYWVNVTGANTFNLATSLANLQAGTYVATSGSQSGVHTIVAMSITISANLGVS